MPGTCWRVDKDNGDTNSSLWSWNNPKGLREETGGKADQRKNQTLNINKNTY